MVIISMQRINTYKLDFLNTTKYETLKVGMPLIKYILRPVHLNRISIKNLKCVVVEMYKLI